MPIVSQFNPRDAVADAAPQKEFLTLAGTSYECLSNNFDIGFGEGSKGVPSIVAFCHCKDGDEIQKTLKVGASYNATLRLKNDRVISGYSLKLEYLLAQPGLKYFAVRLVGPAGSVRI
jgi:hypothetical protein